MNDGKKEKKRMNESMLIKDLGNPYSRSNILIKSENGKKALINLLSQICIPASENDRDIKLTTIFDHDEKDPKTEFDGILKSLSRTKNKISFQCIDEKRIYI